MFLNKVAKAVKRHIHCSNQFSHMLLLSITICFCSFLAESFTLALLPNLAHINVKSVV